MQKILIAIYVLLTSLALVILKLGAKDGPPAQFLNGKVHLNLTPLILSGFVLYGLSFLTYTYLISQYNLGYIVPLTTAFVYIIIFVASFIIFKEAFSIMKIVGISFIVIGIVFLNISK